VLRNNAGASVSVGGRGPMFFERKRFDGISYSPLCRTALTVIAVASLGIGHAYAANSVATGCSLNSSQNPDPTQQALANQAAQAQFAQDPAKAFLTNAGNTISASSSASASGTSLSGTEASTSLVSELIAQRRVQEALICPAGFDKIGGICQPSRKITSVERSSGSRSKSSPMTSLTGNAPSVQATPQAKPSEVHFEPQYANSTNAVWAEAFYDFEKRTGLGSALSPASRTQETYGTVFGADRAFRVGDTQLVLGALGSVSKINQSFSPTSSSGLQNTTFSVDLTNFGYTGNTIYDYNIAVNHSLVTQEQQTLSGAGGGFTASISRGGFFSDGLFKFDLLDLTRTGVSSDTHPTQLTINKVEQQGQSVNGGPLGAQDGCIAVTNNPSSPPGVFVPNPYSITNLQTTFSTSILTTTASNFVLADYIGYHFDLQNGFWLEPLVGAAYTYSTYGSNAAALGLQDGQDVRVQGGGRFGLTTLTSSGGIWTTSLTELVYSDVLIRGFVTNADGFSAGYLLADQGKVRLQSILTSKLALRNGLSLYLECQGRVGNDYYAYGGRVGARLEFY
jgi:hypothetical protein